MPQYPTFSLRFYSHRHVLLFRGTVPKRRVARAGRLPVRPPSQSDEMLGISQVSEPTSERLVDDEPTPAYRFTCPPPRNPILHDHTLHRGSQFDNNF